MKHPQSGVRPWPTRRNTCWLRALAASGLGLAAGLAGAQRPQADFAERWVTPDETLVLRIDAAQQAAWRQWRLFAGTSDITALARLAAPGVIEIRPLATAWAPGQGELVLYDGLSWREVGRWPLKVLTQGGFESSEFAPRLGLQLDGRAQERRSDAQPLTPRGEHADTGLAGGVGWKGTRGALSVEAAANVVGNSHRGKALRVGERGAQAPKVDLADYRVALGMEGHRFELGHLSAGSNPLLAQGFSSRGLGLQGRLGPGADVSLHMLRGTSVVGWDDPTGLEQDRHRVHLLSLGVELLTARPGGLRAEFSMLDTSILSQTGFNTGSVPDAEQSRGIGLRLIGATESGRLSGELALARSRFVNPFDPQLAVGDQLRAVQPATRSALSASTQWQALRQWPLAGKALDVTLNLRHDRAQPLYRTPTASVAADQAVTRLNMQAAMGGATAQLQAGTRVDNLDRLATVLRTRTDDGSLALNLPLPAWLGAKDKPAAAWPNLAVTMQLAHQRAVNAPRPEDSGIAATHRPDQLDRSQQVNLAWSLGQGSVAYGLVRSIVDNRQPGRERADFHRLAHQASANGSFGDKWRMGATISRGRQLSIETGLVSRTLGGSLQLDWQASERWALSAGVTHDGAGDSADQASSTNRGAQLQLTRRFDVAGIDKPQPGQFFVRLGYQAQQQRNAPFSLANAFRGHWVDAGLSISIF